MLIKLVIIWISIICLVSCGCHNREKNLCESICQINSNGNLTCELRGAIILPDLDDIETSLTRVSPVIDMAERYIRKESLIPEYVEIKWLKYDDQCDAALASISAFDAYTNQCVHFIIGPSCEYCVSSVSRITKYFYNDGMNVITGGAFTFDFEEPKTACKDQFYMLNRVGILSFEKISKFTTTLMQKYNWTKAAVLYDRNGYSRVGGIQTCHLMMSSMVKNFLETSIEYVPKIIDGYENSEKESEDLLREIGMAYGGE